MKKPNPGVGLKREQTRCLKIPSVSRKDALAILPTGFGKSLKYQLLPKVFASYWLAKTGERKTCIMIAVSPLELVRKK